MDTSCGSVRGKEEVREGLAVNYKLMQELPNAGFFFYKPEN